MTCDDVVYLDKLAHKPKKRYKVKIRIKRRDGPVPVPTQKPNGKRGGDFKKKK